MSCVHPHIFRMSTKDAYHCLACGEAVKVTTYTDELHKELAPKEKPEYDLWHMIEVDKTDIHILHVSGCDSEGKNTDPNCRVMLDLINNRPDLAQGEYDAKATGMEQIKYIPSKPHKTLKTTQRRLSL
jgi:hypothetical protein